MSGQPKHFYEFGAYRLDPAQKVLLRDGRIVHLTPMAFELLAILVRHKGEIVPKDSLMKELWPDSFVEEGNLAVIVSTLRKTLSENGSRDPYIETIKKRGYRFTVEVREISEADSTSAATQDLSAQQRAVSNAAPESTAFRGLAFRGLLPFTENDAAHFYGREIDVLSLAGMALHSDFRAGVVYGESGCGKTSVLRAGLIPKLRAAGYVPVYFRSYADRPPSSLQAYGRELGLEALHGETPMGYMRRVAEKRQTPVAIIFDQLEGFLTSEASEEDRAEFAAIVSLCLAGGPVPAKLLLSVRSDFLFLVDSDLGDRIEAPLSSLRLYHLRNLGVGGTQEILQKSVKESGLPFEEALIRDVARDLSIRGAVLASDLQILGYMLQKMRIMTLRGYKRAGGKEPILYAYLEEVIKACGHRHIPSLVLEALISEEGARCTLSLTDIVDRTHHNAPSVRRILQTFVESRVVRVISDSEPWRYELMHDYLLASVNRVTSKTSSARQRADLALRQYITQSSVDGRTTIPIRKLVSILRYSEPSLRLNARELLKKSLYRAMVKMVSASLFVAAIAYIAAALLSVRDEWEYRPLTDRHAAAVRRVTFSPGGKRLVSGSEDGTVVVWDFESRLRIATLKDHTDFVTSVAFSPDGKQFASGSRDTTVIVWDSSTLKKIAVLDCQNPVSGIAFSPDGKSLAAASGSGSDSSGGGTVVWETGQWSRVATLPLRAVDHASLLFSPNGRQIVLSDHTWDLDAGGPFLNFEHRWGGVGQAFSSGWTLEAEVGAQGAVAFWDTNRLLAGRAPSFLGRERAHRDSGRAVAFSPDDRFVATAAEDIVLWDAATRKKIARLEYPAIVWSLAFSPDGRSLVSAHADGSIVVWDVTDHERVANFGGHSGPVRAVSWSPDAKHVASSSEDRSVIIWDTEGGRKEAVLQGHDTRVTSVAYSADGSLLASCDMDGKVIVWEAANRLSRITFTGDIHCFAVALSPDGRWVSTTWGVYDTSDGRRVAVFDGDPAFWPQMYGLAFCSDGTRLVGVSPSGVMQLWETGSWRMVDQLQLPGERLISVTWSPDRKSLVTGGDDGTVRLFHTDPLREVKVIGQHSARIKSVAFSPDGRSVASAGDDQTIALWSVNGGLIDRIGTHAAPVLSVAFSPDGKKLVSGENDNSVRIYTRHRALWGHRLN
jgi:WD40 repeat protein/DNA-binding winged helix-turn-helix (wHTH) protein